MTDANGHTPYTLRTHCVHMAAVLALVAGSPVWGDTPEVFAAFQARCLTPMIEVRETVTEGLTLLEDMGGRETWVSDTAEWRLSRAASDAVVQFCAVHGAFGPEVDVWAAEAVASGNWIRIDRVPETLQSTYLREPVIEVEIDREAVSLTVIETNLES